MKQPRFLLLDSGNAVQKGSAGYGQLATQFPDAELIRVQRRDPRGPGGRFLTRFARIGAASNWYRLSSLRLEWRALRALRRTPFDLVHLLWGDSDLGHLARMRPNGTRVVVTLHNAANHLAENFPNPEVLRRVDGFILMSPDQAGFLESAGITPDRWRFIPHGIHISVFFPKNPVPFTGGRPLRVLHVGSYLRDFETLAETTRRLSGEAIEFDVLTSPGVRHEHDFSSRVHWWHGLSQEDLVTLYQNADVLLMTATAATANNALLEGMACGLPVVCQNVSGLTSYLTDNCSHVAANSSASELAAILLSLASDPERRRRMGEASRRHALTLEWSLIAGKTMDFYRHVLSRPDSRPIS